MLKFYRHFLDVPKLTEAELSELSVFAYNMENQQSTQLKPTAITDKYFIVRANNFTSFMVKHILQIVIHGTYLQLCL